MDVEFKELLLAEAEKHALYNALKYQGPAQVKTVMGILMANYPDFRPFANHIPALISPLIENINSLDNSAQIQRLTNLDLDLSKQLEKELITEPKRQLPNLPNANSYGQIRMRVAPNPNGPWHIGHARMPSVIGTYKSIYDGWFVCRFDDTDPATKRPLLEAYDWILEDIKYLGFEADEIIMASDRLDLYYEYALQLINLKGAYTCTCPSSKFSELKNSGHSCPHRGNSIEQTLEEFQHMISGNFSAGEMVIRVRTDLSHSNPAIRDWVAFRMVDVPHPREVAQEYRCWPLLDFQSAIDDHLLEITHIIRGIDLQDSAKRQQYLYDYFNWEYPEVVHWGRINIDDHSVPLSTSSMANSIESGSFTGWSDLQLPTLRNLEKRGIQGGAITSSMVDLGTSTNNITLSMSAIYSNNRSNVDGIADRLFFIKNPSEKQIFGKGLPEAVEIPIHPDHPIRGSRKLAITPSIFIDVSDIPMDEEILYLKGIGSVRYTQDSFEFIGGDFSSAKAQSSPIVHWLPSTHEQLCLKTPQGDFNGIVESAICNYDSGDLIQFERVGFAKLEVISGAQNAYFSHP
jgi:glutamyl-tRNA synthetase